jgi:arylsulfatase A-like enzyme
MTLPIYSSLMTGSYPFMHGVIDDEHGLSSSAGVMAEDLAAEGYRCIGIVGTSLFGPERGRLGRGFHRFSYPDQEHVGAGAQASRIVQVLLSEWPHLSPGFLWLHFDDLAVPSSVPGRYVGRIRPGGYDVGDDVFPVVQQYYGALGYVDSALGAVRTLTAATGLLPETAWLVAGTYGVCLGERGALLLHDELYQETIHVPVIARIPGFSESGRSVVTTISLVDVRSTVCDLTGSLIPPDTHGMSLLPVLRGAEQPRTVFCEAEGRVAAIRWPFKLMHVSNVAGLSSDLPTASVLFNLANDPNETTDCSDQYFSEATDLVSAWINVVSNTIPRYRSVPFRTQ